MKEEKSPQQPIIFEDVEEPEKPIIKTEKKEVTPFEGVYTELCQMAFSRQRLVLCLEKVKSLNVA